MTYQISQQLIAGIRKSKDTAMYANKDHNLKHKLTQHLKSNTFQGTPIAFEEMERSEEKQFMTTGPQSCS